MVGSVWLFSAFLERRTPWEFKLWAVNLDFSMYIFCLMCQSINLLGKVAVSNVGCVSAYFCGRQYK